MTVADTIGAGDTFGAALVDALWERGRLGADSREALAALDRAEVAEVLEHAARAAAVTSRGPAPTRPGEHELHLPGGPLQDDPVRIRIDLAYDGADFHGWAAQPGLRTVEGELSAALATVLRLPSVGLTCARAHRRRRPCPRAGRAPRPRRRCPTVPDRRWSGGSTASSPPTCGYAARSRRRRASTPASPRCGAATSTGSPTTPAPSTRWRRVARPGLAAAARRRRR